MAARNGERQQDRPGFVCAAITHHTGRVLAIQRFGDDRWSLPGGRIAGNAPIDAQLRQHVREATGFDVACVEDVGVCVAGSDRVHVTRCDIVGVGADITSRTRTMRWMDPAMAQTLMPAYAQAMATAVRALGGNSEAPSTPDGTASHTPGSLRASSSPVRADRAGGVQRTGDAVAVGVPVSGQEDAVEALEAVE